MRVSFSRKPGFALFAWSLVVSAVFPISSVSAQIARLELHAIQTQTPTEQEFLTGKKDAKPATISGELRIPRAGTDRLPAVILLHGSGGLSGLQDNWAREFATLGSRDLHRRQLHGPWRHQHPERPGPAHPLGSHRRRVPRTGAARQASSDRPGAGSRHGFLARRRRGPLLRSQAVRGDARAGGRPHASPATLGSIRPATGSSSTGWTWRTSRSASSTARRTTTSPPPDAAPTSSASRKPERTSR